MKQMSFPLGEKERKDYYSIKYTFILQGELMISNTEVMQRLLQSYIETHPEVIEIPDAVYANYVAKGERAGEKRSATIQKKRGRPKKV